VVGVGARVHAHEALPDLSQLRKNSLSGMASSPVVFAKMTPSYFCRLSGPSSPDLGVVLALGPAADIVHGVGARVGANHGDDLLGDGYRAVAEALVAVTTSSRFGAAADTSRAAVSSPMGTRIRLNLRRYDVFMAMSPDRRKRTVTTTAGRGTAFI